MRNQRYQLCSLLVGSLVLVAHPHLAMATGAEIELNLKEQCNPITGDNDRNIKD